MLFVRIWRYVAHGIFALWSVTYYNMVGWYTKNMFLNADEQIVRNTNDNQTTVSSMLFVRIWTSVAHLIYVLSSVMYRNMAGWYTDNMFLNATNHITRNINDN